MKQNNTRLLGKGRRYLAAVVGAFEIALYNPLSIDQDGWIELTTSGEWMCSAIK